METQNESCEVLEKICQKLGVVKIDIDAKYKGDSYNNILIQKIKEYYFDEKDFSIEKYYNKAENAFNSEKYTLAKIYIDVYLMKSHLISSTEIPSSKISEAGILAMNIYEKTDSNPDNSLTETLTLSEILKSLAFQ
ncbi:MAG: hypothetical protein PHN56_02295 [Candidatus Nanoarchaeia archaeon]|nr:hypothetical protein [Candidatus Nanoarchaeia archaeon]